MVERLDRRLGRQARRARQHLQGGQLQGLSDIFPPPPRGPTRGYDRGAGHLEGVDDFVFTREDGCRLLLDGEKKGYLDGDKLVAQEAVKLLGGKAPDATFVYFGNVDILGHTYGFHPKAPRYTNGIEEVDAHVGRILEAMRKRPTYAKEDWLILVCTDHGGKGKGHSGGQKDPEVRTGFLILHGPTLRKGAIDGKIYNVDVAVTALTHLGVPIKPEWKLDGRAVGLKK